MGKAIEAPLTVEQVAELLHLSAYTTRQYLQAGTIRGYKMGKSWRVDPDAVEEYKQDCREAQNRVAYVASLVVYPPNTKHKKATQSNIQYAPLPSNGYVLRGPRDAR